MTVMNPIQINYILHKQKKKIDDRDDSDQMWLMFDGNKD